MANQTVRDIIQAKNAKDAPIMKHLKKTSGILATGQSRLANDGIKHVYQKLASLPSLSSTLLDDSVAPTTTNKNNYSVNLSLLQAYMSEPANVLDNYPGGARAFFREQMEIYNESFFQDSSKSIIYGNNSTFGDTTYSAGLHQYAKAYSNVITAGGDSGSRTTIFAVNWSRFCTMLFNENDVSEGKVLRFNTFGGTPRMVKENTTTRASRLDYEMQAQGYIGFVSATKYDVAAYTQIQDAADDRPTATNLDKLLDYVKADPTTTFLYMSRTGRRLVEQLADSKYQRGNVDNDYNTRLDYWNTIPIVIDDNIRDDETTVLD